MTILGRGDLSPPRRHRRRWPRVLVVLVLLLAAAGAYAGWRVTHRRSVSPRAGVQQIVACPSPTPTPPAPAAIRLAVRNTTGRVGLAHRVAAQLRRRGFVVAGVGNGRPAVAGVATVTYGSGERAAAEVVAGQIPGATLAAGTRPGLVLALGRGFRSLGAVPPSPSPSPSTAAPNASPSPSPAVTSCHTP